MNIVVSIIIPNYNHAPFLKQRLETVLNQTYQDFEMILMDDASTDSSLNILEHYKYNPKVSHFIINETNSGSPFKQWQKGIALAKGEYIWIAESDDYCEPEFLESLIQLFAKDTGVVYCQTQDVDENGNVLLNRVKYTSDIEPNYWQGDFEMDGIAFIKEGLLIKNVIPNASAVVFKKSLIKPQTFDESLLNMKMCGDWYFWVKLSGTTCIYFNNKTLNFFRNHPAMSRHHKSKSKKKQRLLEESIIRNYSFRCHKLRNSKLEKKLLVNWFKLHTAKDLFNNNFYKFQMPNLLRVKLVSRFVIYKLKTKLF